jgi:DNA repair exonuclease SbcCD ATPase subunit
MKKSAVRISALEIENLKRVRAVTLDCSGKALSVIGGRNGQGKTSVLDAICWALGGDRFRPSKPVHEGAEEAYVKIDLDNGVTVERKGVNGSLKVTSATGKGGQSLLNEFVNLFALNLPKFMAATGTEKAKMLLEAFPDLGPTLQRLNEAAKALYNERHAMGQVADRKKKYAAELPFDALAPDEPLSGAEMAKRMQEALSHNARNDSLRNDAARAAESLTASEARVRMTAKRVAELEVALADAQSEASKASADAQRARTSVEAAKATAAQLQDQDTSSIEAELEQIDALNARVRANESKRMAEHESEQLSAQYAEIGDKLEETRAERIKLLAAVKMPLDGLSIDEEGELIFADQRWDCMSGSEQLRVATAICAAMQPKCAFVLLDKLEAMDTQTLREFGAWLEERGLQAIGTRVGTGEENSIVIEDGVVVGAEVAAPYEF